MRAYIIGWSEVGWWEKVSLGTEGVVWNMVGWNR